MLEEKYPYWKFAPYCVCECFFNGGPLKTPCNPILFCKHSALFIYLFPYFCGAFKVSYNVNSVAFVCLKLQCLKNSMSKRERRRIVIDSGVPVPSCFENIVCYCLSFFSSYNLDINDIVDIIYLRISLG